MSVLNPEVEFMNHLAQGRFMIQRCGDSGRFFFYPRIAEPGTGNRNVEWVEANGFGTVYSTTVVRNRPPEPNHNVALIDLAEGVRLMSRVVGISPEDVRIGMRVHAKIIRETEGGEERPILVFEPD